MDSRVTSRACLFLWHGRSFMVGPGIDSTLHAHYALQLTLGLDGPFGVRLDADAPWIEAESAVFAPNQLHQLDCGGRMMAHLFVELPQRQQTVATMTRAGYHTLPGFVQVREAVDAARRETLTLEAAEAAAQQWLACAIPAVSGAHACDPRIARTLQWLADHPGAEPDGAMLAAQVHLSESRFTHLFRQQTGLPLSRYLLWTRLLDGVAAVAEGDSLTEAAHRAGFADLAHMSRTFRNTFGVAPSELQKMTIAFKRKPR